MIKERINTILFKKKSETDKFEEMRERAKRRKSKWNLILIPIGIFWIALFSYGYWKLIDEVFNLTWIAYPDVTYVYQNWNLWGVLTILAIFIPAISIGLFMTNITAWLIRSARNVFEKEAKGYKGADFKTAQKDLFKAFIVTFIVGIPFIILFKSSYVALSYDGFKNSLAGLSYNNTLMVSPWYSLSKKEYNLDKDLRKIKITVDCGKDSTWNFSYKLKMNDDKEYEIASGSEKDFFKWIKEKWDLIYFKNIEYHISQSVFDKMMKISILKDYRTELCLLTEGAQENGLDWSACRRYIKKNNPKYFNSQLISNSDINNLEKK